MYTKIRMSIRGRMFLIFSIFKPISSILLQHEL